MRAAIGHFLAVGLLLAGAAPSAMTQAEPAAWVGDAPILESVADIMARDAAAPASLPGPLRPRLRKSQAEDPAPAAAIERLTAAGPSIAGPLAPQSVGTSFLAAQSSDSPFIPPDTMGAVGPSQIVVCVNGRIKVFDRAGTLDPTVLNVSTDTFFNSVRNGTSASDCRVRFDRDSKRWFVTMMNTAATNNRIMIAVSQGATITPASLFSFYQFQQNTVAPAGNNNQFADYPTLGIDKNALYLGVNMFTAANAFAGSTGFVVQKSALVNLQPIVVTALRGLATNTGVGAYTPQGVDNDDPAATKGFFVGVDISTAASTKMVAVRVLNPGSASPAPSVDATLNITVPPFRQVLGGVSALGSTTVLDDVDNRLMMAQMTNGSLWTVHATQVNASGVASATGGRDGARWYEVTGLMTASPILNQSGTLFDSSASNPASYFVPSIAASGQGHVALASTVAGAGEHAEIAVSGRLSGDPLGTLRAPTVAQTSTTAYNVDPSDPAQRWGDFSFTCVDPNDNMTLWTFQEYCNATDSWGVRVIQLRAPPPATPASVTSTQVAQNQPSVNVTLTGTSVSGSGFYDPGAGFPNRLGVTASGGVVVNSVTVVNPTTITLNLSTVGATLGPQDITVTNPDGQSLTGTGLFSVTTGAGAPACTVTPNGTATNLSPFVFTLTFSEGVSGFSAGGVTLTNGSAGLLLQVDAATYTLAVSPTAQGPVTCQVNSGVAHALDDNQTNLASAAASVLFDTTPPTSPGTPGGLPTPNAGTFTVSWTTASDPGGSGVAGYTVERSDNGAAFAVVASGVTALTLAQTGLLQGTYQYRVAAVDAAGNAGPPSGGSPLVVVDLTPPGVPGTPSGSPNPNSTGTFTVTWTAAGDSGGAGIASYTVQRSDNGAAFATIASGLGVLSLPQSGLPQGSYRYRVFAIDAAGNIGSAGANSPSVIVDKTGPGAPGTPAGSPNPNAGSFTVSWTAATDAGGSGVASYTVQRSDNGAAFATVATGIAGLTLPQNGLAQGSYRFQVIAVDGVGIVGPASPVSSAVLVYTTAPHTTIVAAPPNPSSSGGSTFVFRSSVPGCSFQTKLDAAASWTSNGTATLISYSGLANGSHTFQVRAVDAVGNVDPTPPSYVWTINTSGGVTQEPDTIVTGQPLATTAQTTATFTFISTEPGGTFDVQLDGGAWTSNGASGTKIYNALPTGTHTFQVRAVDTALNGDPTPASVAWTIVAPPVDQVAPVQNPFSDDAALTHWTISSTDPGVTWNVDATPASMPGNPFFSAPSSLNYNNGTDYDTPGFPNSGSATSPSIAIAALSGARLKFFCNYQTETPGSDHDHRVVQISNDGFATLLVDEALSESPGSVVAGTCAAMGTWHEHVLSLAGMTGPIQVRFLFDTGDAGLNNFSGWFVDDFEISDLAVSGLQQLDPGTGSLIPVGGTVASSSVAIGGVVTQVAVASVTLEVEVQPVGTAFTGVPTATAIGSGPGSAVGVSLSLADGAYHWRARTVTGGVTSSWMSFGLNAESDPDFVIQVSGAAGAVGGGGHHHGCGLTGLEGILGLAIVALLRRSRNQHLSRSC